MQTTYQKNVYDKGPGYKLHHTVGTDAKRSTLDYPHFTTEYMLLFFLHGCGNIKIEGTLYEFQEGDIILTNPSELFMCTVYPFTYHERIVLHLYDSFANNFSRIPSALFTPFLNREKGCGNKIDSSIVRSAGLDTLLNQILSLVQQPGDDNQLLVICKITELLLQLRRATPECLVAADASLPENSLIHPILTYLNMHYTEEITVTNIANIFNIHPSHLAHLFKEHVGMSLWNYVILRRLHSVNSLLIQGLTAEEACYKAGFRNYSNFFRLYKKHTGMTPAQFKKEHL